MRTSRRHFLSGLATAGAGLTLFPACFVEAIGTHAPEPAIPVRIQGHVEADGAGIPGVAVTDGRTIVTTDAQGAFSLISASDRPFVYLSLPDGYRIPQHETGTARFYEPIVPDARGEMQTFFHLERDPRSYKVHHFLALADPQTLDARDMDRLYSTTVPDVRSTVSSMGDTPVFGITCGDIVFDNLKLFPAYERAVRNMGVPFFQVVGNHDLDVDDRAYRAATATFRHFFGPTYYAFDRGAVHYVVLDDVRWQSSGYTGFLDEVQLQWLAQDLARVERGRTVVVFTHIPVFSTHDLRRGYATPSEQRSIGNRDALYRLLEPYVTHIISGHTHEHEHVFAHGSIEHVIGTVCGAWWSGPICADGTPNGYGVFEVRGDEVRWRYKASGLPDDHQLRVYARAADPSAPEAIVANVWDWDPGWSVHWYEDDEPRGAMTRRTGTDPLAEALHRGPALPVGNEWVEPFRTDHLFVAHPRSGARTVVVEATDRWGRTYTAESALG